MEHYLPLAVFVVVLALIFNFTNGFSDSANQVATVISSRALSPEVALTMAALANLAGAFFLGTKIAETIGKDIVNPALIGGPLQGIVILSCALLGAISWDLLTWRFGIPSSSSHALVGGLLGAFIAGWGMKSVQWHNVRNIVLIMLISPLIGFFLTYLFTKTTFFLSQWAGPKANQFFKKLQIFSSITQAVSHGTNDAQKGMGIIVFALIILKIINPSGESGQLVPRWVMLACSASIAMGTMIGGWRIIKTLGTGLFRVRPVHGFASQTASTLIIYLTALFGFPISSTQVISSSVMGAGAAYRPKSVRWELAGEMVVAWLVTIPASAFIAAFAFKISEFLFL